MRFSPYDMADYGLHHSAGILLPFEIAPEKEAEWNLFWATVPELDAFLDLQFDDFDGYHALIETFPFSRRQQAKSITRLTVAEELIDGCTPAEAALVLRGLAPEIHEILGAGYGEWLNTIEARLAMAQSLVDMREAAALCQSVVAVDFRARKRL